MRAFLASLARRDAFTAALIAVAAFIAVVVQIDPAGDYPNAPQGPGITIDEIFNVQEGVRLVEGWYAFALGAIDLRDLYGDERMLGGNRPPIGYHFPDHPPLGRIWLGVFHNLSRAIVPPGDHPSYFVTACARVGSAAAFALTVFLAGWTAARWYGASGGVVAAVSLILMPRVFGHAHLAALESTAGLANLAAVLAIASYWIPKPGAVRETVGPHWRTAAGTGVFLGLALLTKIQGVLIIPPVVVWALFQFRQRALLFLTAWGVAGLVVFFVGWPWLWFDPIPHLMEYLGRTTDRLGVNVWYFGQKFADRDVPWHYPTVMFATTIPLGLHLLGLFGAFGGETPGWKHGREQLLLAAMVFPIVLFSYSNIVVYDGERLFLISYPLWAMLVGRGGAALWKRLERSCSRRIAVAAIGVFLALQSYGLVAYSPLHLSYYNLAVGGLRGADRLGLERTYWGESVTREILHAVERETPPGSRIHVAPLFHHLQLRDLLEQSPILRRHRVSLMPFRADNTAGVRYVLFFSRFSDLPEMLRVGDFRGRLLAETRIDHVQLAALYEWDGPAAANPQSAGTTSAVPGSAR